LGGIVFSTQNSYYDIAAPKRKFDVLDIIKVCDYKFMLLNFRTSHTHDAEDDLVLSRLEAPHDMALVSSFVVVGDHVVQFRGSPVASVMRRTGDAGKYLFLGRAILFEYTMMYEDHLIRRLTRDLSDEKKYFGGAEVYNLV
jgi:hypothetical protein